MYDGTSTDDKPGNVCKWCQGGWLNIDTTSNPILNTCDVNVLDENKCKDIIYHCEVKACYKTSTTTIATCLMCKPGFWPNLKDLKTGMYTGCTDIGNAPLNNVENYRADYGQITPYSCKLGYVLDSSKTTCVSSTQRNCRVLQSDGSSCLECIDGYVWNFKNCELQAVLFMINLSVIALLAISF